MKKKQDQAGTALVVVIAFMLLSTVLSAAILTAGSSHSRVSNRQLSLEKALFVAEAGVERAAQYISDQKGYLPNVTTDTGTVDDGAYNYTITKTAWRTYRVNSVGTVNGIGRQVNIDRVYLPTFAQYALWMHVNGVIYFIGGEEFDGHVHSNDKMYFASQNGLGPIFHEIASTAQSTYGGSLYNVVFDEGFHMNADEGQMADVDFTELRDLANSFGLVLEGNTTVAFEGDNMRVTNTRQGWNNQVVPIGEDQLVYIKNSTSGDSSTRPGKVNLSGGSVDGRMTIVTEDDILINNHITYANDPRTSPSENSLGLISKDDVWVQSGAPNNLNLHAAILATGQISNNDGSFGVINYNSGPTRGPLNVLGSIVQEVRGAVGTFNSSGPATGYYKNYSYDLRFATNAPPYYPVLDEKIKYAGWSEGPAS